MHGCRTAVRGHVRPTRQPVSSVPLARSCTRTTPSRAAVATFKPSGDSAIALSPRSQTARLCTGARAPLLLPPPPLPPPLSVRPTKLRSLLGVLKVPCNAAVPGVHPSMLTCPPCCHTAPQLPSLSASRYFCWACLPMAPSAAHVQQDGCTARDACRGVGNQRERAVRAF